MEDVIIFVGAIIFVLIFVTIINKIWGKKDYKTPSHYDADDVLDRMQDNNDNDYDFDNDRD